jgi:hypothetical protein
MSHQKENEEDQVKQVMMLLLLKGKSCQDCGETNEVLFDLWVKDKILDPNSFSPEQLCQEMKKSDVLCVMCSRKRQFSKKSSKKAKSKH